MFDLDHLLLRLVEHGHVSWCIVVFTRAHVGIRGGVHLRRSLVDHGDCHFAEHGGVVEQVISKTVIFGRIPMATFIFGRICAAFFK